MRHGARSSSGWERMSAGASCSMASGERWTACEAPVVAAHTSTEASSPRRRSPATSTPAGRRGVDPDLLDPVLLTFANRREAQNARFGGELFPAEWGADPHGTRFIDYFDRTN